jgi:hypothetical protein
MKKMTRLLVTLLIIAVFLVGCGPNNANLSNSNNENTQQEKSTNELPQTEVETDNQNSTTEKAETSEKEGASTDEVVSKEEPKQPTESKEATATNQQNEPVVKQKEAATKPNNEVVNQPNAKESKTQEPEKTKQAATDSPTNTPTASQKDEQETKQKTPVKEATITIRADAETGVILKVTKVSIEEGDTVLELLKKVTKQNRIHMEYRGSGPTAYIEGIQNLYEFDKGPKSGWMYSVNGVFMKKGAGTTEIQPGDKIEWAYTLDLGKDLGATVNE